MTKPPVGRVRWVLLFWIFVMGAITYLDRVNISVSGRWLAEEYHFDNLRLGWVFSAFAAGYALFQVPGGRLADRFGARRVLTFGALWWSLFTAATALVPAGLARALALFLAVRFLLGAGEAVIYPASNCFVANWIPSQERGIANGVIFAGVGVGAALSSPLVTWVVIHHGWRASFWVCAAIGALAAVVWFFRARDTPEIHPRITAPELEFIRAGRSLRAPKSSLPWSKILKSRNVLAITFSYFCYGYIAFIFFTWFFIYLVNVRGVDLRRSAVYTMLPFMAMTLGSASGGWVSDLLTRWRGKRFGRCGVAVFGLGLSALFIAIGALTKSPGLASVVLAGGAGALYLSQSSFWAVSADIAGRSAGSVSGFMNMGAQSASVISASLTPWIGLHFHWAASFLVAASLGSFGALAWLLVDPERVLDPGSR